MTQVSHQFFQKLECERGDWWCQPKKQQTWLKVLTTHHKNNILWMEEILHQLVNGFSHSNPIIYSVS